jgi:hypothetical protein
MTRPLLSVWAIYDHPRDIPDKYVARRHDVFRNAPSRPSDEYVTADSLEEVRLRIPQGLYRMPRSAEDDPKIMEIWM